MVNKKNIYVNMMLEQSNIGKVSTWVGCRLNWSKQMHLCASAIDNIFIKKVNFVFEFIY